MVLRDISSYSIIDKCTSRSLISSKKRKLMCRSGIKFMLGTVTSHNINFIQSTLDTLD